MKHSSYFVLTAVCASVAFMASAAAIADMENPAVVANTTGVEVSGACTMVDFETQRKRSPILRCRSVDLK